MPGTLGGASLGGAPGFGLGDDPAPSFGGTPGRGSTVAPLPLGTGQAPTRITLPNETAQPGENFVLALPAGRFGGDRVGAVLRSASPLPFPFEYTIDRDMVPVPGSGGNFVYTTAHPDERVTCVLVIGTRGAGLGRPSSVMMRNCVNGDAARALAPLASLAI